MLVAKHNGAVGQGDETPSHNWSQSGGVEWLPNGCPSDRRLLETQLWLACGPGETEVNSVRAGAGRGPGGPEMPSGSSQEFPDMGQVLLGWLALRGPSLARVGFQGKACSPQGVAPEGQRPDVPKWGFQGAGDAQVPPWWSQRETLAQG